MVARDELIDQADKVRTDQRPRLWQALGDLYTLQRDPKNARKAYREWSKLLPDDPVPWLFLLEQALVDGSLEAEAAVQESLASLQRIGGLYQLIGEASVLLRGPLGTPMDVAGALASDKILDKDKGKVQETATKDTEDPKARDARLNEAEKLIDKIQAQAPQKRNAYVLRRMLWERRNKPEKAAAAYEECLSKEGGLVILPYLVRIYARA